MHVLGWVEVAQENQSWDQRRLPRVSPALAVRMSLKRPSTIGDEILACLANVCKRIQAVVTGAT